MTTYIIFINKIPHDYIYLRDKILISTKKYAIFETTYKTASNSLTGSIPSEIGVLTSLYDIQLCKLMTSDYSA